MPKISDEKIKKIEEQILYHLFSIFPKSAFTSDISKELARDEEFMKTMLLNLNNKNLVLKIDRNSEGIKYERRLRWRISNKAYDVYNKMQ